MGTVPNILIAAHIFSMLGFSTYPALLPQLQAEWGLSNSQAGIVGSFFFAGYIGTVSFWTALTDRVDGRWVYAAASALTLAGCAGFGFAAQGFVSASALQLVLGAGVAGTYMPGLRLLTDVAHGPAQSRYIAFYTSFFGVGAALSFALAGWIAPLGGWRMAFVLCALGSLVAGLMVFLSLAPKRPSGATHSILFPLAAWRRVLANRASLGYMLGYGVHCLELFGSRGWMVAFLAFAAGLGSAGGSPWGAATIAAVVNLAAVPASILGNEVALRVGRRRWVLMVMSSSSLAGIALAFAAPLHWAIVIALLIAYSMLVMAESATMTAGYVAAAPAELRGAAMGLYSLVGFGGGMLGPALFGAALDLAGGQSSVFAWACGYAAIGAGCLAAPVAARLFGSRR
ncbi:MAG: MFS transporter [Betaproteobacteria bacterium]|nr:MFS transporter [Betaproteobacteria bacterium]MDH5222852.1 MFS transporter [Betaproteobacteria bacterium]MDH5352594.1 MFS transporter [Betaproteobacteria bacterium]